jgi:DNA-binding MarR family transcriptional regulator
MPLPKRNSALDTDGLLRDVVRLFAQAQRTMTSCCSDASSKECEALVILGRANSITIREFAQRMSFEKTWASRLLTRLEKRRFIKRAANPKDGRSSMVELTPVGRAEFRRLESTLNDHAVSLIQCVPAKDRHAVEMALELLRDALNQCLADFKPKRKARC